ncbi:hypothetical protein CRUP_018419 [Coryphaenoides rupestris]|nr:hypothetical protein CRUP_018419 [Coryphaenoides rupestris]
MNDIESDPMYRSWPSGIQELLRATFPGVIRQIRRNLFNLVRSSPSKVAAVEVADRSTTLAAATLGGLAAVLFLDPAQEETVELVKLADLFYKHKIPLRIGFIFVVNTEDEVDGLVDVGVALYRLLSYVAEEYDLPQALTSMVSMFNRIAVGESLSVDVITGHLKRNFPKANAGRVLGPDSEYDDKRQAGARFYEESGLGVLPVALFNGIPLDPEEMDPGELETLILQRIMDATNVFQRAAFTDYLMEQPHVVPRINPLILSTDRRYLDFTASPVADDWEDTTMFSYLDSRDKTAVVAKRIKYFTKNGEEKEEPAEWKQSHHFTPSAAVASFGFMRLNEDGMSGVTTSKQGRALSFTPEDPAAREPRCCCKRAGPDDGTLLAGRGVCGGMDADAFEKRFNTMEADFVRSQQLFCRDVLRLGTGQRAVISNGRRPLIMSDGDVGAEEAVIPAVREEPADLLAIIGPLEDLEDFPVEDFTLLERMASSTSAEKVKANVKQMGMKGKQASDLIMKLDALLAAAPRKESRKDIHFAKDVHSVLQLSPRDGEVVYDVVAVLSPRDGEVVYDVVAVVLSQVVNVKLQVLSQVVNVKLQVFMNCRAKLSELPLKSFYRLVLEADVNFLANNSMSPGPGARFTELPESPLLTLNMITPDSWMVEAVSSPHDLDNIHLQEVNAMVSAEYELEHLLLEGHCFDLSTGQPPRGLQFTLGTGHQPLLQDTIVMANLGYFQLKANPGAWILRLRKGRSEDIYQILAHDGTDSPADAGDVVVTLNHFQSKIIKVKVQKKAEKINEDLLSESTESRGLWDSIARVSWLGGSAVAD